MNLEQRKQRADSIRGREARRVPTEGMEIREINGTLNLSGWASVTERSYDMGWYTETVKRGAFTKTLSESPDVQLLVNHEGLPLARTASNTLRLSEDERGLKVDADLDKDDPDVDRVARKVARGDMTEMSFAFRATRSSWDEDYTERDIVEADLNRGDVSMVNFGANPATSFSLRDATSLLSDLAPDELDAFLRSLRASGSAATDDVASPSPLDLVAYLRVLEPGPLAEVRAILLDLPGDPQVDPPSDPPADPPVDPPVVPRRTMSVDTARARLFVMQGR